MESYGNASGEHGAPVEDTPGGAIVPVTEVEGEPDLRPWHTLSDAQIKAQARLVTQNRALANWESDYALVCAALGGHKKIAEKDRLAIASSYARRKVHRKELQVLHKKPGFTKLLRKYMGEMPDDVLEEYRARAIDLIPEALEVQAEAIRVLKAELKDGKDKLGAVRAAPPLVNPFVERALPPKRGEGSAHATSITITLSTHQAARIDAPEYQSEAVEAEYEVVSEEVA